MFIHLRLHTEYSLIDGLVRIEPLVHAAAAANMPAIAVTDQANLFAVVKFYRAAIQAGVKPIIGADLWLANASESEQPYRFTLLCQDQIGYRHLTWLVSQAYLQGQTKGYPTIQWEWLVQVQAGLIALSGAQEGDIGQALLAGKTNEAIQNLQRWQKVFPDRFYIEVQRVGHLQEAHYLHAVLPLAERYQIPVVATNDVRFLAQHDFIAHETKTCIHGGYTLADPNRPRLYTEQQYLRTAKEMKELFADLPSAIANTVEIAKRCNVELTFGKHYLPAFPIPAHLTEEEYLAQQAHAGLHQRLTQTMDSALPEFAETKRVYEERLRQELEVINQMGFAGYFLIVADFIQWAKQQGIPVGPGRGSGAGSLVAYVLLITDIDPIKHDLLFERFLNPERVSMPDFDIDFCMLGRDRVIDYVAKRYGRNSVAQIITYGTMAAKAVIRDVGRVLGHPYGFVDKLAKLIPFELGITLDKALEQEPALRERYEKEEEVKELIELAKKLEGLTRNVGTHAGGVVIAPTALTDFTALYCEPGSQAVVTQFDKDDVEAIGLVKFDFLGLRTLTIIDQATRLVNERKARFNEPPIAMDTLPLDDLAAFRLLQQCQTTAVFQLESKGIKDLIKRLQPDSFADIVALVALYRPGPLQSGMVDDFINRKHGRAKVEFPHPKLASILRQTYGVIVYQEQVMQIAQELAGYTLGGADLLRRAMGKKKPEEMAKQRAIFLQGATKNGIDGALANYIFDLMEKFAGYGFNKSHSVAYALLAYQTAWLKAHYPAAFMAAVLSADMDHTDKVVMFLDECKALGLTIRPPHINSSYYEFTVLDERTLSYGLGAIKGIGANLIHHIIEERNQRGPFVDLFDFCARLDTRRLNRRAVEVLIKAGAMDNLGAHRAALLASLQQAMQLAEKQGDSVAAGQVDLFADWEQGQPNSSLHTEVPPWDVLTSLQAEKQTLGWYASGHPLQAYAHELKQLVTAPLTQLKPTGRQAVTLAGLVHNVRLKRNKHNERIAIVTLEDETGRIDMLVFAKTYAAYSEVLQKEQLVIVQGDLSLDKYTGEYRITANELMDLMAARERFAKGLHLRIDARVLTGDWLSKLKQILHEHQGGTCPVLIHYLDKKAQVKLQLNSTGCVKLTALLFEQLTALLGEENVTLQYHRGG